MAETEVANVLREIRERVRAEGPAGSLSQAEPDQSAHDGPDQRSLSLVLSRLQTHLETTDRAWDKLPPLTSKRTGLIARLELWFKRQMRRSTRWYAWEQINFNAAVNQALHDIALALATQERASLPLREQVANISQLRARFESHLSTIESRITNLENQLSSMNGTGHLLNQARQLNDEVLGLRRQLDEGLARLHDEQSGLVGQLQEAQRVSFKQLALEIRETTINSERAHRLVQSRIDELAGRIGEKQ